MAAAETISTQTQAPRTAHGCAACNLRVLCLPAGFDAPAPSAPSLRKYRIARGACLYRAGQALRSIFAIRAGVFKSRLLRPDGREQVTGFHMRGEIVGLEAIGSGAHLCDAVALEDGEICEMPFSTVDRLCADMPLLNRHLRGLLGREIAGGRAALIMLNGTRAEERIAAFLLDLSQRHAERGCSAREFDLPMKREEIGSYLGMQIETVSRVLSQLQRRGVIGVRRKRIRILEPGRLREITQRARRRSRATQTDTRLCALHRS